MRLLYYDITSCSMIAVFYYYDDNHIVVILCHNSVYHTTMPHDYTSIVLYHYIIAFLRDWASTPLLLGCYCIGVVLGCYWDIIGMLSVTPLPIYLDTQLLGCYWDVIGMSLGCYWDVIGMLLGCYWGLLLGCYWCGLGDTQTHVPIASPDTCQKTPTNLPITSQ